MKLCSNNSKSIIWIVLCFCLLMPVSLTVAETSGRFISINFNNVDINVFVKFISELTGKNFIVDRRVKGKVTIISPTKISVKEAYKVFESVLEVHGYTTVRSGKIIKIVPSPDARAKNIETKLKEEADAPEDRIVTHLIPLKYANPNEIKRLFAPLISKSSVILAYSPTNILIVTDVYSNIKRLLKIVKAIDIIGVGQEISVIPLEHANAPKLAKILDTVFKTKKKPRKGVPVKLINIIADERTNTIVLLASEDETIRIKKLVKMLDKEIPRGKEKIHVFYLENATAEDLAKVLQALPSKPSGPAKGKKASVVSEQVRITADKSTNSLIIMAEKEDYLVLEEIIKKLDIPRAMVYIECLIMEVNVDKDFKLGTEWTAMGETSYKGREGGYGGGFSDGSGNLLGIGIPSVIDPTSGSGPGALPSGFSLGVFGGAVKIGNAVFPNLGAVVRAYKKDKDVHILSTPQILTMDNEEAKITVGKNIPYQTKVGTTAAQETYSTYEYKDVGITLKITPNISKDRMVRLNISQEVNKLESTTEFRPTTLKRTIETTVIVNDKNTIVIGGLIDDSFSRTEYKVPCLGDIPLTGWLFKSRYKGREKTNLFVFLTPHVIESPAEAKEIYRKKKDQIDKVKEGKIKMYKKTTEESVSNSAESEASN